MEPAGGVTRGCGWSAARAPRGQRKPKPSIAGLAVALLASAALLAAAAAAASKTRTSVSLHIASGGIAGRVGAATPRCVKHRAVWLQEREGRRWITVAKLKSSRAGRFKRSLSGLPAGKYRVSVRAHGSCARARSSTVTTSSGPVAASCQRPLTHDAYDGFHIAVPDGWELFTLRGALQVEKDASGDEAVLISPAIETSGLTPGAFFSAQLSNFKSEAAAAGRAITVTGSQTHGGVPSATFTASVGGQTVTGYATVLVQQFSTQLSSSQIAFVAAWAPASTFSSEASTLGGVAACYGPEPASLYHVFQDQAFTYMMPLGWTVANETQDALDLVDGHGDYATYQLVGGSQFSDPPSLINVFLSGAGISSVNALWTQSTPSQQLQNGQTQSSEYEEFTGMFKGGPVHGLIFALTDTGGGFNTGVVRIVLSSTAAWNAVNGALFQIVGSIQHNFTQDLQTMQRLNQQWQNFSNQVANFDDILNNQQLTQDPTSGIYYYAPYDNYRVDGPAGPGYYLNDQRLNIINR